MMFLFSILIYCYHSCHKYKGIDQILHSIYNYEIGREYKQNINVDLMTILIYILLMDHKH